MSTRNLLASFVLFLIITSAAFAESYTREEDSLSLVELYTWTDGDNWTSNTNWFSNAPLEEWHGVKTGVMIDGEDTVTYVDELHLPGNNLTGRLPELDLIGITFLKLSGNNITGTLNTLNTPKLRILDFSNNELNESIIPLNLPELTHLYLNDNNITGEIPDFNLPNLLDLVLRDNELEGEIPLFNMPSLKKLDLKNNKLTGSIPNFNLPFMEELDLSDNKLTGPIPYFQMEILLTLDLTNNQLTGELPDFNLPDLRNLYLGHNNLDGELPEMNVPSIRYIDISYNNFSGQLSGFDYLQLRHFFAAGNNLSGNLNNFNPIYLERLYLDSNKLTGLTSPDNFPALLNLKVKFNKLTFEDLEPYSFMERIEYSDQDTLLPVDVGWVEDAFDMTVTANGTFNSYNWQKEEVDIPGAEQKHFSTLEQARFRCKITNTLMPELTLYSETVDTGLIGVEDQDDNSAVKLYPNPFRNDFVLEAPIINPADCSVILYNTIGQVSAVYSPETMEISSNRLVISVNSLAPGAYTLIFRNGKSVYTKLVIKE